MVFLMYHKLFYWSVRKLYIVLVVVASDGSGSSFKELSSKTVGTEWQNDIAAKSYYHTHVIILTVYTRIFMDSTQISQKTTKIK